MSVEAEIVDFKYVGPNFIMVRLVDGVTCKLTINVEMARIKDQRNADGTPAYHVRWKVLPSWTLHCGMKIKVASEEGNTSSKPDNRLVS